MINLGVDLEGVSNVGPKVRRGIERYLIDGAAAGHAVAANEVPEDRGTLRKNMFQPEIRDSGEVVHGVADVPYALAIEEGTGPYTPPIRPLLEWADRAFGTQKDPSTSEVLERINNDEWGPDLFNHGGMAVWSKIRSEGVSAQPYLEPASEAQRDWYQTHDPSDYIEKELK